MAIRCCATCVHKESCLLKFNVDQNTGCVNWFEDTDIMVAGIKCPVEPEIIIECKKITLTHNEARIEIDSDLLENFSVIIINDRKYVLEDK